MKRDEMVTISLEHFDELRKFKESVFEHKKVILYTGSRTNWIALEPDYLLSEALRANEEL